MVDPVVGTEEVPVINMVELEEVLQMLELALTPWQIELLLLQVAGEEHTVV